MAINMEEFVLLICEKDIKKLQKTGQDIIEFLKTNNEAIDYQQLPFLVDGLILWLYNSNFKIVLNGLEALKLLASHTKDNFAPYVVAVVPAAMDKLGDQKDQVREAAQNLLCTLMEDAAPPQIIFEKLATGFAHKQWHVREECLITLQHVLNKFGNLSITTSKYVPAVCKLLHDQNSQVRDQASNTLVVIYTFVGDRFRADLLRKNLVTGPKLTTLLEKFEEIRASGKAPAPDAEDDAGSSYQDDVRSEVGRDEPDRALPYGSKKSSVTEDYKSSTRSISAPPVKRGLLQNLPNGKLSSPAPTSSAGAMDEESFYEAFEDVTKIQVLSQSDLDDVMTKIRESLSNDKADWNKRNEEMRKLRGIVLAGAADYPEFFPHLRLLEPALQLALRDLRSQVVREVCITVAFFAQVFGIKFEHCAEYLLPSLMSLMSNTVKIMSTSGVVAIKFIIRHVHSHRIIPILVTSMSSKSREIRRNSCEFLDHILHTWDTLVLEKHTALLQDAIKKGLQDADAEVRASSRKAYWGFADHFKDLAEALLLSLDPGKQRMLKGEVSNSSSSNSLHRSHKHLAGLGLGTVKASASHKNSYEDLGVTQTGKFFQHPAPTPYTGGANASSAAARSLSTRNAANPSYSIYKGGNPSRQQSAANVGSAVSIPALLAKRSTSAIDNLAAARARRRNLAALMDAKVKMDPQSSGNGTDTLPRLPNKSSLLSGSSTRLYVGNGYGSNLPSGAVRSIYYANGNGTAGGTQVKSTKSASSMSQPGSRSTSPSRYYPIASLRGSKYIGNTKQQQHPSIMFQQQQAPLSATPLSRFQLMNANGATTSTSSLSIYNQKIGPKSIGNGTRNGESRYRKTPHPHNVKGGTNDPTQHYPQYHLTQATPGSDEDMSESSSFCSDKSSALSAVQQQAANNHHHQPHSGSSSPRLNLYVGTTDMDSSEILSLLTNANWSERKEGLIHIIRYFRSGKSLKPRDIRPVMDAFTKMFMDPHSKVFSILLDALTEMIRVHCEWLNDWVYILLAKLLNKMGQELLSSIQTKCQKLLEVMRSSFPASLQFDHLCKFLTDQTMTPNHKVKGVLLLYMYSIVPLLKPSDFNATDDAQINTMSKVINLINEPKSPDVRKAALHLLVAMFNLNPASFTMILNVLPKHQQDTAKSILSQHIKPSMEDASPLDDGPQSRTLFQSPTNGQVGSPNDAKHIQASFGPYYDNLDPIHDPSAANGPDSPTTGRTTLQPSASKLAGGDHKHLSAATNLIPPSQSPNLMNFSTPFGQNRSYPSYQSSSDTATINTGEACDGQTSVGSIFPRADAPGPTYASTGSPAFTARQPLPARSALGLTPCPVTPHDDYLPYALTSPQTAEKPALPPKPKLAAHTPPNEGCNQQQIQRREEGGSGSKIPSLIKRRSSMNEHHQTGSLTNGTPPQFATPTLGPYRNRNGSEMSELTDKVAEMSIGEVDLEGKLSKILTRMKSTEINFTELTEYLNFIRRFAREGERTVWERNFQYVFPILLKLLNHANSQIRMNTLLALRELIRSNPEHFTNYAEISYVKLLSAMKDDSKEVSRCAEETGFTLARTIPAQTSFRILSPMIQTGTFPLNLQAINALNQMVEHRPRHCVSPLITSMVDDLIKAFDAEPIAVRKASVFCLVAIYMKFGDHTLQMLSPLTPAKRKLLQVYIDRAKEQKSPKSARQT